MIKLFLSITLIIFVIPFAVAGDEVLMPRNHSLNGVWLLDKDKNPNPRQRLISAIGVKQTHKQRLKPKSAAEIKAYGGHQFLKMLPTFLFPYSDWIEIEQYKNGISINYAEGEFREYWTDEKNTPEFTGISGETKAYWAGEFFLVQTNFKKEKIQIKEWYSLSEDKQQLINRVEVEWKNLKDPVWIKMVYDKKN